MNPLRRYKTTRPLTVIAGLTRNPLCDKSTPSHMGDGGSLSAMTVKSIVSYAV